MMLRSPKLKWILLICFLLMDMALAQAPPSPRLKNRLGQIVLTKTSSPLPAIAIDQEKEQKQEGISGDQVKVSLEEVSSTTSANRLVSTLAASLRDHLPLHGNLSCAELSAGPWRGSGFSRELLALVMVPVLASAGCITEAQSLVMNLFMRLGPDDTQELLQDIMALIKLGSKISLHTSSSFPSPPRLNSQSQRQLQAVMFNIQQLAEAGENVSSPFSNADPIQRRQCQGWLRVKGAQLLGQKADGTGHLRLNEAKHICHSLGLECAGVAQESNSSLELYRVILRPGSRVVPLASPSQSESWIQRCGTGPVRWRRHAAPQYSCKNEKEERVYTVVEWIPGVSTLYNLGTAVYYASVNCTDTAKERAILTAVDLGTDALMAVTGGTAGVAGYALGAGLKTGLKAGIKYMLNNMNQEDDLLMNQNSWEDGSLTIQ